MAGEGVVLEVGCPREGKREGKRARSPRGKAVLEKERERKREEIVLRKGCLLSI